MTPLRLGLLTTAGINRVVLNVRDDRRVFDVVAVGSRDRARARAYADTWGIERAHGSYDDLLADPDVEAVYIALPNALHQQWSLRALAAGKHVLCEKPFSRRPDLVEEAFAAAADAGLVLMEAGMWRHNPQTRRLVELLPEIGELQVVRATFSFVLEGDANVRLAPELGGGALLDLGWYCVGGIRLLAGEPERVTAEAVVRGGIDVSFGGLLRCGDVVGELACGFTSRHASLEAIGSEGTLLVRDPWLIRAPGIVLNGEEIDVEPADSYRLELANFAAAVRGTAAPLLDAAESVAQARALDALLRAAASGLPVLL